MQNTEADQLVPQAVIAETWIHVVAGVIFNESGGAVLLAQRPLDKHQGGKWEFPGGKAETGEAAEIALSRELDEELGIQPEIGQMKQLIEVRHRYPGKNIFLDVWEVRAFTGEPYGREGQQVRWFSLSELTELEFPEANAPILAKILQ